MTSVSSSILTGLMSTMSSSRLAHLLYKSVRGSSSSIRTEALVADIEVPEVDPKVISRYVSFTIRVDRYRVDMVSVGVRVHFSRHSSDNVILDSHTGKTELGS